MTSVNHIWVWTPLGSGNGRCSRCGLEIKTEDVDWAKKRKSYRPDVNTPWRTATLSYLPQCFVP
jgi:hypothetical protein